MSYQHGPACWVQQLGQMGISFSEAFRIRRPRLNSGTGLSAPDVGRVCEFVVIADVVANVDALAAARAYAAVLGAERRAAKRIGSTMAEGSWDHRNWMVSVAW